FFLNKLVLPPQTLRFVESLSMSHRGSVLKARSDKKIPAGIEFVTVVVCTSEKARGDGVVARVRQWTKDLREQGVPFVRVTGKHDDVMDETACVEALYGLVSASQPRWDQTMTATKSRELE